MKVLVVEDNADSRNLLVKQLRAYGNEVAEAADGVEALEMALKDPPDILVSDILMPRMDGYQLCYDWRRDARLKDIPFVFYTAIYTSPQDEKFALSLGASHFIRKPTEPEALAKMLAQVLEQAREGRLPAVEAAPLKPSLYLSQYSKRLVAKLNEKVGELEKSEAELEYLGSVLMAIRNINQLIVREGDKARLLRGACKILLRVRDYRFAWIGLIEAGHKRIIPAAKAGVEDGYLDAIEPSRDDSSSSRGPTGKAIKSGQPVLIKNIAKNPKAPPWRAEALKRGYNSLAAIPLVHGERVYGALNVYSRQPDGFSDAEVSLLREVSGDLAFALTAIGEEAARRRAEQDLKERMKELRCLYNIETIVAQPRLSLTEIYRQVADTLPLGWQYPEITAARLTLDGRVFKTKNYKASRWQQSAEVKVDGVKVGKLEVVYLERRPKSDEGPFLKEERQLIDAVAARLARMIERRRTVGALQESEARYRAVIEGAHDMIQSIALDGSIIFVNEAWLNTLGYTKAELASLNLFNIIHPDSMAHCQELFKQVISGKPVRNIEASFLTKDGRRVLVEGSAAPRYIGDRVVASQGIFRDVTERKRAQEALQAEQNKLQSVAAAMEYTLTIQDKDFNIIYQNESSRQASGGDHTGEKCYRVYEGRDTICDGCPVVLAFKDGQSHVSERQRLEPSGEITYWENTANPIRDAKGEINSCLELARDITERKEAEAALADEATRHRILIDESSDGIAILNEEGEIYEANKRFAEMLGYTPEEILKLHVWDFEALLSREQVLEKIRNIGPEGDHFETKHRRKDGTVFDVEISSNGAVYAGHKLIFSVCHDITERKKAAAALADEATRRRILIDESSDGIVILDEKGGVYEANKRFAEMLGYTHEEAFKLSVWDWEYQFPREQVAEMIATIGPEGDHFETRHRRKDGTVFDVEISTNGAIYAGQKLIFCVCRDITDRKQAEAALKESEAKYKTLIEATSDIIWEADERGVFTFISPRIKDLLGYEVAEVVGKARTLDFVPKGEAKRWIKRFKEINAKKAPFFGFEITHLHKNGRPVICEVSGIPLFDAAGNFKGFVGINKDITSRKQMQEQLVITDRLASVGELAAGIAHELNNPLTGVIGFSQLLMDKEMPEAVREDVKVVYSEAQRAAQVVKNLLTFARKHTAAKQMLSINSVIGKVLELRAYEQRVENIKVKADLASNLPEIMADYFQLQQVFLNIIINAEYFMKEAHNGGTLTITTERVDNKIRASFADDGPGIAKDDLGHLFDPFFTTKEVGKGTGLGLSICHGIVAEHGGRISVESELGKGATFIVELPLGATSKKGA